MTDSWAAKDCSGTAQAYFTGSKFAQLSETYGYVVLYPNSVSNQRFSLKIAKGTHQFSIAPLRHLLGRLLQRYAHPQRW